MTVKDIEVHLSQAQIQEIFAELPADELELPAQAIDIDEAEQPFRFLDHPPPLVMRRRRRA